MDTSFMIEALFISQLYKFGDDSTEVRSNAVPASVPAVSIEVTDICFRGKFLVYILPSLNRLPLQGGRRCCGCAANTIHGELYYKPDSAIRGSFSERFVSLPCDCGSR